MPEVELAGICDLDPCRVVRAAMDLSQPLGVADRCELLAKGVVSRRDVGPAANWFGK